MVYDGSSEVNLKNNLLTVNMFVMYRGLRLFPSVQVLPGFRVIHAKYNCLTQKKVCKCLYFPELYAIITVYSL